MQLSNKTLLVTGGNSGIGLALVKRLHAMGNQIIVVSRSQNNWPQLRELTAEIIILQCDLSKQNELLELCQQLKEQQPAIDMVINCAAQQFTPTFIDEAFSFDSIAQEISINFTAIAWLCHQLLPRLLLRPEAAIVNISSGLAIYPKTHSAIYCASKAALHSFSQSLGYQLEHTPIRVIEMIMPLVETPMTHGRGNGKISADHAAAGIIKALEGSRNEVYIGKARIIPILARIWPGLIKKILKEY